MSPVRFRAVAACLLASAALTAPAATAGTWSTTEPVTPAAGTELGALSTDLASDGDGRITAAYQWCGEPDSASPGSTLSCSVKVVTRSAATGNWGSVQTLRPAGPTGTDVAWVEVATNDAGDTAVLWEECQGFSPTVCAPWAAMRPRGRSTWTAPAPIAPYDPVNTGDSNVDAAITLDDEGTATATWSRRNWSPPNRPFDLRARSFGIDDPDAATPTLTFEPADTLNPVDPGNSGTDQATRSTVTALADGTTIAAWWYYSGACSTIRYAVRPLGGTWSTAQGIRPDGCADAARLGLAEPALIADGTQAVLIYSAEVDPDPDEVPASYAKTYATTISATGTVGPHTKISNNRLGLLADQTSGYGDTWRAGLARNAAGVIALGAYEASPTTNNARPVVVVRSAAGTWSAPQPLGDEITYNVNLPWAPGITVGADGTVTAVWGADLGDKTESPFNVDRAVLASQVPLGGAPSTPVRVSPAARRAQWPMLAAGPDGTPVAVWRAVDLDHDDRDVLASAHDADGATPQPPNAAFTWQPQAPKAGDTVTFTSTSTDPDGPITGWAWDFDDDGNFDDASGAQVTARFDAAGSYPVELRVTDGDDQVDYATNVVVVDPAPAGATPTPTPQPTTTPGTPDVNIPAQPTPAPTPTLPAGFVVRSNVDTNGTRTVPAVTGRALDDARTKLEQALRYVDITTERVTADAAKLGKRPGGGKWKIGDVVAQTPSPGTAARGSAAAPTPTVLRYWAGAKSDRQKCTQLRSTIKRDDLDLALAQLKAAGCGTPDLKLVASKTADDPTVKSLSKDHEVLTVSVPTDQSKTDIVIWKNTGFLGTNDPGPVPSASGDLQLTAGQRNVAGVILRDRAGRALNRASVTWDLSGVGGGEVTSKSIESGVAPVKLTPQKAGTVRVLVSFADASGDAIYGSTEFRVVDRSKDAGFVTAIGQSFKRTGSGASATFVPGAAKKSTTARRLGLNDFFGLVAQCVRQWGGAIAAAAAPTAEGVLGLAKSFQVSVAQLWRGPVSSAPQAVSPRIVPSGLWLVQPNGVVSAGGGNVVAAGGMNVIAAGGGNVVAAGGMNVISAGGGNVVSAGGGNILTLPDGAKVISAGGGNVVAAGGMNVISAGGGNVVSAGGGN
jgi:plastocyanin